MGSRVGSKYTCWDQIQLSQIKYKYTAFLYFNSNINFQFKYKYTAILLFQYDSNTLSFFKFDLNTIQIHALFGERHIEVAINGYFEG